MPGITPITYQGGKQNVGIEFTSFR
ncbi:hypothetical protein BIW11_04668 [Tropilaelaps mercedesae]|uniref:Uncharacterized protein n=1 Tax=Tropilaelaps mercedesae TaxID=418985 RepID=A0A1V9X3B8_9ACAR|nr:hypothetical protein BIW11_04668 [Tropilaelaps mercedesae]